MTAEEQAIYCLKANSEIHSEVCEECPKYATCDHLQYAGLMEVAIQALERSRWIPVSEALPNDDRPVLIYAWNVHHVIARYGNFRTENGYKETWVTADAWNGNTEIKHEVIAWMPLPEAYRAEREG